MNGAGVDAAALARLARDIREAEISCRPIKPPSSTLELTVAEAYQVQDEYCRLRQLGGALPIGHKIGATSMAAQENFGIDKPDLGRIFDDMVVADGGALPVEQFILPMVEPEIAFILADDIYGPGVTGEEVLAVTASVAPGLEIIDTRIADWRIRFVDTIVDNGSSARCVLGPSVPLERVDDLAAETVHLSCNGQVVGRSSGAASLGHPATAVAWLANELGSRGSRLCRGDVVLSGSLIAPVPVVSGQQYEAHFSRIGTVSVHFL